MHYPAKRTMWSMFCFRFIQLLNIALIMGAIFALAVVILDSIQHYRDEKIHPSTVTSVIRSESIPLPQIVFCSYNSITLEKCFLQQRMKSPGNEYQGYMCYNKATGESGPSDTLGHCPPTQALDRDEYYRDGYNCINDTSKVLEFYFAKNNIPIVCFSINGPNATKFAPYLAHNAGKANSLHLKWYNSSVGPANGVAGLYGNDYIFTPDDWESLTTSISAGLRTNLMITKSKFVTIGSSGTATYFSSSNSYAISDPLDQNASVALYYFTMDVVTITETNKYGLSNAVADIGGISGSEH